MYEMKTERVPIMLSSSMLRAIDDFRFENRISSRAEAVRHLIELGLVETDQTKKVDAQA